MLQGLFGYIMKELMIVVAKNKLQLNYIYLKTKNILDFLKNNFFMISANLTLKIYRVLPPITGEIIGGKENNYEV